MMVGLGLTGCSNNHNNQNKDSSDSG
jgi:enterochelin esterase-like enzyme